MLVVGLAVLIVKRHWREGDGLAGGAAQRDAEGVGADDLEAQGLWSSSTLYSVPASQWVILIAASRMVSSRRLMILFPGERDADGVELFQTLEQVVWNRFA